jgi:hypothetical protein
MTENQNPYEQWLAKCRQVSAPAALADQIMSQVARMERQRRSLWWLRLVQWIERSRASRWAVYGGALAMGCLPFVFLAYVAQFVEF